MAAAAAAVEQPASTPKGSYADTMPTVPVEASMSNNNISSSASAGATALYEALAAQSNNDSGPSSSSSSEEEESPWTSATHRAESLAWRRAFAPARLTVADVAPGLRAYGIGQHGVTRAGEPILWCERFGHIQLPDGNGDADAQTATTDAATGTEDAAEGNALGSMPFWKAARLTYLAIVYALEHSLAPGRRRVALVINCAGMTRRTVDERLTRILTDTTAVGYPACLGAVVLYNAPRWIALAWRTLGRFVPRDWRQRLHVAAGAPAGLLRRLADPAQLPRRFGGRADDALCGAEHYIASRHAAEVQQGCSKDAVAASSSSSSAGAAALEAGEEVPLEAREDAAARYSATLFWIGVCRDTAQTSGTSGTAPPPPAVERAAWLKKQGGIVPLWRKYFFVLQGHALLYKNAPGDAIPNNAVDLRRAAVHRGDALPPARRSRLAGAPACVLVLDTPQRTFTLLCASEAERNAWAQALQQHCCAGDDAPEVD